MKKKNKLYAYQVEYASGLLRSNGRNDVSIVSNKQLQTGQFVVIEHKDCGVFIGVIADELNVEFDDTKKYENYEYRYLKDINLDDWVAEINKKKRIEELKCEMENKFAEIDKQKKFEYYAQIDDDFRELYLEYEDLNKKEVK